MAAGSLAGVFLGTSLLPFVDKHLLKGLLGAVLLLATVCLALPVFFGSRGVGEQFDGLSTSNENNDSSHSV